MRLDSASEVSEIVAFLRATVQKYLQKHRHHAAGPHHRPVSAFAIRFDPNGGFDICIDTRVPFEFDGAWAHDTFTQFNRPLWQTARDEAEHGNLQVVTTDGKVVVPTANLGDEEWTTVIGNLLVVSMKQSINEGTLATLPRVTQCFVIVEDLEGFFTWQETQTV